jgi:hypothetical protein
MVRKHIILATHSSKMEKNIKHTSRRDFLRVAGTGLAALSIVPSNVIAGLGHTPPSDRLNIAAIGVGGVGFRNLNNFKTETIVALCDVDWNYASKAFRRWNDVPRYTDFRLMLEKEKKIDAVLIATPDHTHSVAAMAAMQLHKHVFVQAPMAHSVFEARRMVETARVYNVVSQVGNQGASGEGTRQIAEFIWSGNLGEVTEVHAWTTHPQWIQGNPLPDKKVREPKDLSWDLFVGPAKFIDYNPEFTPFTWRAWWNFGNGALGSMGPHILEPVFRALKLNAPSTIDASSTDYNLDFAPKASKIVFEFNRRDNLPKVAMPKLKLYWYDGGLLPERPSSIPADIVLGDTDGGLIFKGSEGILVCNSMGEMPRVYKNGQEVSMLTEKKIHRISEPYNGGHEADFVRACKESTDNRLLPTANFESQLSLTETILTGNMAIRMQSLNRVLYWDSSQMRFTNIGELENLTIEQKGGIYIENGIPKFKTNTNSFKANFFVERTVRPLYRSGWQQV